MKKCFQNLLTIFQKLYFYIKEIYDPNLKKKKKKKKTTFDTDALIGATDEVPVEAPKAVEQVEEKEVIPG